jgi:hypothetical protein
VTPPPTQTFTVAAELPPSLDSGKYQLVLDQDVAQGGTTEGSYSRTYSFTVAGPRFTLDPTIVHSQYPPAGGVGAYAEYMPQVVLTQASLPWERTIAGAPPARGQTNVTPWLAILLLDDSAAAPAPLPQTMTVGDLLKPPAGTFGPQGLTLDPIQTTSDECQLVDVPAADFLAVAPAATDLPYLAHVREVDHSQKATPRAAGQQDDWYAVVVGNRIVQSTGAGQLTGGRAYLVSLEGFEPYLPGGSGSLPAGTNFVRLAVMASWSFTDNGTAGRFEQLVDDLDKGPLAGPAPEAAPATGPEQDAADALAMGYTPLTHTTRQGEQAVSWYRGPLVPLPVQPETTTTWPASDAALRFDPGRGMLDVSYAAAWQLGRLLILASTDVAQALFDWRRGNQTKLLRLAVRGQLRQRLSSLAIPHEALLAPSPVVSRISSMLAERLGPLLTGSGAEGPNAHGLTLGDPTGLRHLRGQEPGLLGADELEELMAADDPVDAIARKIGGDGS